MLYKMLYNVTVCALSVTARRFHRESTNYEEAIQYYAKQEQEGAVLICSLVSKPRGQVGRLSRAPSTASTRTGRSAVISLCLSKTKISLQIICVQSTNYTSFLRPSAADHIFHSFPLLRCVGDGGGCGGAV